MINLFRERVAGATELEKKLIEKLDNEWCKVYQFGDGVIVRFYWRGRVLRVFISMVKILGVKVYKFVYMKNEKMVVRYWFGLGFLKHIIKTADITNKIGDEV